MPATQFYFDDPEGDALAKETCHPNFVANLKAEFYYSCIDDLSPFGNDDGADLLYNLEDHYRESGGEGNIVGWLFATIDAYGFKYESEGCSKMSDEESLKALREEDPHFINCMNNTIIAAAFGQIKISGKVNSELRELAINAIKRQLLVNKWYEESTDSDYNENLLTMLEDLKKF